MVEKIPIRGLTGEEWLAVRKKGIGGSDAGAICGLNPYVSPMNVYLDKTTETIDLEDNEAMRQGRDLEDYVARRFEEATGKKVRRSNVIYRNQERPFMLANVDRMIVGEHVGLECKTASAYSADKWKDGEVPAHYQLQCYHYMAVTGAMAWYIAVVILGQEFKYVKIPRDETLINDLISIEERFWTENVVPRKMPDPDGSKVCDEVLEQYFHTAKGDSVIPLIGFDKKLMRREEITHLIEKMEQEQRQIDQEIKLYMQDHERAVSDHYRVSWTNTNTARLDVKRIKEERPDLYQEFVQRSGSRRFSIRAA